MTRRRNLEQHRHSLDEIREIMNSMKTLAYMETRKLSRFLDAQQAVVQNIQQVAADLLSFHADTLLPQTKEKQSATTLYILFGTERGFCGDFNHALLRQLDDLHEKNSDVEPILISIGHKLNLLIEDDPRLIASLNGVSVLEEVPNLINQLVEDLIELQDSHNALEVYCLYHGSEEGVVMQRLLPPFQELLHQQPAYAHPPQLNQSPRDFMVELTEHYLFAALHNMVYTSLMAENQSRVSHLEGAVNHLDDETDDLKRQVNALRQEEIIEEIEVILLNAGNLSEQMEY